MSEPRVLRGEQTIVAAHDRGLINENALVEVLQELLAGQALTAPMLASIFGIDPVWRLAITPLDEVRQAVAAELPPPQAREDLYRAAAITGFASAPGVVTASSVVNNANAVVEELRAQGALL